MIIKNEKQKEHFIIFLDKDRIDHICKYVPVETVEKVKQAVEKEIEKAFDGKQVVDTLAKNKLIQICDYLSARFIVARLS